MAYTSAEAVALRMGREVTDLNTAQVDALIGDISALVDAYTGLDFTTQTVVPTAIQWVVTNRVIRALNNPDGIKQEQIGTYSYTLAAEANVLVGGWTEEERSVLDSYGNLGVIRRVGSLAIGY